MPLLVFWENTMRKILFLTVAALVGSIGSIKAETLPAIALDFLCNPTEPNPEMDGMCMSYILGSYEGMIWGAGFAFYSADPDMNSTDANALTQTLLGFCLEPASSNEELVEKVSGFISAHPNLEGQTARNIVMEALRFSYPCE